MDPVPQEQVRKVGHPYNKGFELLGSLFGRFGQFDCLNKPQAKAMMRLLADSYASANFGYKHAHNSCTLGEDELVMLMMKKIASFAGYKGVGHYEIEEVYAYPIDTDETPDARAKKLLYRVQHGGYRNTDAVSVAEFAVAFYGKVTKTGKWWQQVLEIVKPPAE